eukprot:CAMPEP_0116881322 /NCGR_PEP_ID=MMETSP0463-20121206/13453_1 /TAXON_ID=181622 /ORGANISM="Strombidinopsis sp, Strain SopsisLIS2011" /LENGTH=133 /DNA_ID=CAMNT_0004533189 /DNA_START=230 /DNA_END=631 /DNA_ORIENTATION=+
MTEEEFKILVESSSKNTDVEVNDRKFYLRQEYPINNKQQLRDFILKSGKRGIKDSGKLHRCYSNKHQVKSDIQELRNEGWIRAISFKKGKAKADKTTTILFPRDLNPAEDKSQSIEITDLPRNCLELLADTWD